MDRRRSLQALAAPPLALAATRSISRALGVPMTHAPYRGSALSLNDVEVPLRFAVYVPAATPAAKEELARIGHVPAPSTAAEVVTLQKRETEMWGPIVKASAFTPED